MDKLDQKIAEALSAEDQEILSHDDGFFAQNLAQFKGPSAWASWLVMGAMFVYGALMIWCGIKFVAASEVLAAVKWGVGALGSMVLVGLMKLYLAQVGQTDRIMRELKRVELMLARKG